MDLSSLIKEYVKPELLIISVVLYFISMGLKKTKLINDKFIPAILGVLGIIISGIYIVATSEINSYQEILMATFTTIVQGILVAGISVYLNKIIKQSKKEE